MINSYKSFWQNYANFNGRTTRAGYWWVFLCNAIISLIFTAILTILFIVGIGSAVNTGFSAYGDLLNFDSPIETVSGGVSALLSLGIAGIIIYGIWGLYSLATLIPSLAISIRRLHDTGRKWFWILLPYVGIVVYIIDIIIVLNANSLDTLQVVGIIFIIAFVLMLAGSIWLFVLTLLPTSSNALGEPTFPYTEGGNYGGGYSEAPTNIEGNNYEKRNNGGGYIVGVAGEYKGQNIEVPFNEEIIIGRDAAYAHIVIKNNATKISRKHVSISMNDNGEYIVTDHSSNGLYKADGTRLPAGAAVSLSPGTVIYLGKENNSFRLG